MRLTLWDFDECQEGWDVVKNSMGLLKGHRLMAGPQKVQFGKVTGDPQLGCRGILDSVNTQKM